MAQGKQAKLLTEPQQRAVISLIEATRYPTRNRVIFLLSVKAGLRAKEIALLTWDAVSDAEGKLNDFIELQDKAAKGKSGRVISINKHLRAALAALKAETQPSPGDAIVRTERAKRTSPQVIVNLFAEWYRKLGFAGASSHSGRRTFITNAARKISTVGGSLRDVQVLAGHTSLSTTQRYIERHAEAQKRIVDLV